MSLIQIVGSHFMNDGFTFPELSSIHSVRKAVDNFNRGILTHSELSSHLLHVLVESDTASVAAHCASLLPCACFDSLTNYVAAIEANKYYGHLSYVGPGLSEAEQRALQPRFRIVCQSIRSFLDSPTTPSKMPDFPIDIFWHYLLNLAVVPQPCKSTDCSSSQIKNSVFCPFHHYYSIKGQPPKR